MVDEASEPARRRRHGAELEAALLDAAWEELVEAGYPNLTMASVAARAGTSEPVLYRRWANKDQLVLAALERYRRNHLLELPDTGSLREDLLSALTGMRRTSTPFFAVVGVAVISGVMRDSGLTPAEIRDRIIGEQRLERVRTIYRRAHDRGELDLAHTPAAVLQLPFDLVRHDLLMGTDALAPERITSIVDELFLPLVEGVERAPVRRLRGEGQA